jgi:hypothetical protein
MSWASVRGGADPLAAALSRVSRRHGGNGGRLQTPGWPGGWQKSSPLTPNNHSRHQQLNRLRLSRTHRGSAESRGRGCRGRRDGYGRHGGRRRRRRGGRCAKRHVGTRPNGTGLLVRDGNTKRSHGDYGAGTNDGRYQLDPLLLIRIHSDHSIRLWLVRHNEARRAPLNTPSPLKDT